MSSSTRGGGRGRDAGRGRGRHASKQHIECYKCRKLGHYQYECPSFEGDVANYGGFNDEEHMLLMKLGDDQETERGRIWFLDSGDSTHMCGTNEWFVNLMRQSKKQ